MKLHVVGIDLGKTVFHLVAPDSTGRVVIRRKCSRRQLLALTANLEVQLIGMESCSGSHFLGRALREQGQEVRLMPAQYVKPHVQTNKSDYLDAEAIADRFDSPHTGFDRLFMHIQTDTARENVLHLRLLPPCAGGHLATRIVASLKFLEIYWAFISTR